jgi:hypothetical protein
VIGLSHNFTVNCETFFNFSHSCKPLQVIILKYVMPNLAWELTAFLNTCLNSHITFRATVCTGYTPLLEHFTVIGLSHNFNVNCETIFNFSHSCKPLQVIILKYVMPNLAWELIAFLNTGSDFIPTDFGFYSCV